MTKAIPFGIGGAILGYAGSLWGQAAAHANYLVRPELADVSFVDTILANHGMDYLYYNYPGQTTAAAVVLTGVILGIYGAMQD